MHLCQDTGFRSDSLYEILEIQRSLLNTHSLYVYILNKNISRMFSKVTLFFIKVSRLIYIDFTDKHKLL